MTNYAELTLDVLQSLLMIDEFWLIVYSMCVCLALQYFIIPVLLMKICIEEYLLQTLHSKLTHFIFIIYKSET